jgi:D-proline reductase (dithiol) PrdB
MRRVCLLDGLVDVEGVMVFSYVEMMRGFGLSEYAELPSVDPVRPASTAGKLTGARVGLFSTVGAHLPTQRPFQQINDLSFRMVPLDVPTADLEFDHPSPIRGFALEDLNVVFPRDRLVELCDGGVFAELAPAAVSMLGSITLYSELVEKTVPLIADVYREQEVDLVLLVPFCPACHRATHLVARGLEAQGVPCITMTALREMGEAFKPARPVFADFPLGATVGRPHDAQMQREVLRSTLAVADSPVSPWQITDLPQVWSADRSWEDEVRALYADRGKDVHRARVTTHIQDGEKLAGRENELNLACGC